MEKLFFIRLKFDGDAVWYIEFDIQSLIYELGLESVEYAKSTLDDNKRYIEYEFVGTQKDLEAIIGYFADDNAHLFTNLIDNIKEFTPEEQEYFSMLASGPNEDLEETFEQEFEDIEFAESLSNEESNAEAIAAKLEELGLGDDFNEVTVEKTDKVRYEINCTSDEGKDRILSVMNNQKNFYGYAEEYGWDSILFEPYDENFIKKSESN